MPNFESVLATELGTHHHVTTGGVITFPTSGTVSQTSELNRRSLSVQLRRYLLMAWHRARARR
jgi:hypothetical protein